MTRILVPNIETDGIDYILYTIWQMPFYIYGLVAILGFVFIVLQSLSPVRHAFYELFLHLHIALAVMSFVALWYHLKNLLQQRVLLGTLILWGLDVSLPRAPLKPERMLTSHSAWVGLEFSFGAIVESDVQLRL
jgi:hypothetical protein